MIAKQLSWLCRARKAVALAALIAVSTASLSAQPPSLEATRRRVSSISVDGSTIVIEGQQIGGLSGMWNASQTVYTLTIERVYAPGELPINGEPAHPLASVRAMESETETPEETGRRLTLVAELASPSQATVLVSENANRVQVSFSATEEPEIVDDSAAEPTDGFEMIRLRYADVQALSTMLRRLVPGGDRSIQIDERLNVMVVDRAIDRYASLVELIDQLDQPGEQILIDAQIVELRADAASQLGLDLPSSITMSIGEDVGYEQMVPFPFQTFLRSPVEISATLDLLTGDGRADILANPRVATIGGVPAVVQTQERFPIIVTQSSGGQSYQTKQDIVGGIAMTITPRHNGEGEITTVIETDVTTITGTTKEGYPTTSSRQVSTTVRVQSGQAIVIGGLQERREIEHDNKFPLLGEIPLLGLLFTNRRTKITETDLYVIVTPYLIGGMR